MEIKKAISNLKFMISELEQSGQNIRQQKRTRIETFQSAIFAMQELEQYRQIGTIKEFKECKEIIGKAEADELAAIIDGYLEYRNIGTPEECREAREKQEARKPIKDKESRIRYTAAYICPGCGQGFAGTGISDYCYHCGQRLDWGKEND